MFNFCSEWWRWIFFIVFLKVDSPWRCSLDKAASAVFSNKDCFFFYISLAGRSGREGWCSPCSSLLLLGYILSSSFLKASSFYIMSLYNAAYFSSLCQSPINPLVIFHDSLKTLTPDLLSPSLLYPCYDSWWCQYNWSSQQIDYSVPWPHPLQGLYYRFYFYQ